MTSKTQIKNLLKKKKLTGKEVGQLLIASMINDIKQIDKEKKDPLFTQSEFEAMEMSIINDREYTTYGVYRDIYSSVIDCFNRGQGLYQQFYNGFSRLFLELREYQNTDNALKALEETPFIMTDSQYKRLEAKAIEKRKKCKESFYSLFFAVLDYFLEDHKIAPKNIKDAIEATNTLPVKDNNLIKSYNEIHKNGYYLLPDGRRSDTMNAKEWEEAIKQEYIKKFPFSERIKKLETFYETYFKGLEAIKESFSEEGATEEEIEEASRNVFKFLTSSFDELKEENPPFKGLLIEFIPYDELPEELTLYDFLSDFIDIAFYDDTDKKQCLKFIKETYPLLYKAIEEYIKINIPQVKNLKTTQYYKEIITWEELAELNFIGYKDSINPTNEDIIEALELEKENINKTKRRGGIAILKNPQSTQTDANGDYKNNVSLLGFFRNVYDLEEDQEEIKTLQDYIEILIYPALGYLYSYNALLEIIEQVYEIPELAKTARRDTKTLEEKIAGYNSTLYFFYYHVCGSEEEKQRKRSIIKEVFKPLDPEEVKPTEEAINGMKEELLNLGFTNETRKKLKYLDPLINRLMTSKKGVL